MEIESCRDTLDALNGRCRRLLPSVAQHLPPIPDNVRERLPRSAPLYCFGLRPFMASASTVTVIGIFLAALQPTDPPLPYDGETAEEAGRRWRDQHRYFAELVSRPWSSVAPIPFEYNRGDEFDYYRADVPTIEDLPLIARLSDDEIVAWLAAHCSALAEFVIKAAQNG